jgi:hypothetical protein
VVRLAEEVTDRVVGTDQRLLVWSAMTVRAAPVGNPERSGNGLNCACSNVAIPLTVRSSERNRARTSSRSREPQAGSLTARKHRSTVGRYAA